MDYKFWIISLFIVILSLILNWFVQLSYYFWRKHNHKRAFVGQKTLLNYYTGYLGDGIIVPIINVLIFYVIVKMGLKFTWTQILLFYAFGLVIDIFAHFFQGKFKLTNWSMPEPFYWNFAGYWHMFSFPIQMGYLAIFFWIIFSHWPELWVLPFAGEAVIGVFGLMLLFIYLYIKDNKWI